MNDFQNEGFLRRNMVWVVVVVALVIFGLLLFKGWDKVVNDGIDNMITVTGSFTCLPVRTDIELEEEACLLGVRDKDGLYFALDISRIQDANTDLKADDTIAVTGIMRPESEIPTSNWAIFDIAGIIQVNTLLRTR